MNSVVSQAIDRHSHPKRIGGFNIRSVAWVVLASWLFSLAVCSVADFGLSAASSDHHSMFTAPHHSDADTDAKHGGNTQHEYDDTCCTVLQSPSLNSHVRSLGISLQNLSYALLSVVIAFQLILFVPSRRSRLLAYPPPDISSLSLIANSLWPNAPPR